MRAQNHRCLIKGLLPIAGKLTENTALVVEIVDSPLRGTVVAALADAGFRCAGLFPNVYKPEPYLARRHQPFIAATVIPFRAVGWVFIKT